MLMELIINAQNKDENAMMSLISRFNLLLKKYARKLNQEDAYADMVTYFIELIHSINIKNLKNPSDAGVVTYINRSVYNYYCYKIKEIVLRKNEIVMTDLSTEQVYLLQSKLSTKENVWELDLEKHLTEKEFATIYLIFVKGYSAERIARIKKCSRQSVNQTKKRALKKIRLLMDIEEK